MRNFMMMCPLLKEKCMTKRVKTIIYNSIPELLLTYGTEYLSLTKKTSSRAHAVVMKVLQTQWCVPIMDRLRNEQTMSDLSLKLLLGEIE